MILEVIFDFIKVPIVWLLSLLPEISLTIPSDLIVGTARIFSNANNFVPMTDILLILTFYSLLMNFATIWSILTKLWSLLPFT